MATDATKARSGKGMWPFVGMSLETATWWFDFANLVLLGSLLFGVLATFAIVRLANVKEHHWDAAREQSQERMTANEAETAQANARASVADQKAAEATLKAETERVERLKLEAKYAPRVITDEQVASLAITLAPLRGQSVDVVSYETLGTDVAEYAFLLTVNLNRAGLHAIQFTPMSGSGLVVGVRVRTEKGSSQEQVAALVKALKDAGVPASPMAPYPVGEVIAGGYMGPTGVAPAAKLRLLVGAKP